MAGPGGIALADGPPRFIALFIDFIIIGIIGFIVDIDHDVDLRRQPVRRDLRRNRQGSVVARRRSITVVILLAVTGAYFIYMWTRMGGATVGMRRVEACPIGNETDGRPRSPEPGDHPLDLPWCAVGRQLPVRLGLRHLPQPLDPGLLHLPRVQHLHRSDAQGLHDKQAKTVVAKSRLTSMPHDRRAWRPSGRRTGFVSRPGQGRCSPTCSTELSTSPQWICGRSGVGVEIRG